MTEKTAVEKSSKVSAPSYLDYPVFRISVLRVEKASLALQLAEHNANMGALLEAGQYRIEGVSIQDTPTELQIVVILQRKENAE